MLKRQLTPETLQKLLSQELKTQEEIEQKGLKHWLRQQWNAEGSKHEK